MTTKNVRVRISVTLEDTATGRVLGEETSEQAGKPDRVKAAMARQIILDGGFMIRDLFDEFENQSNNESPAMIEAEEIEED